MAKAMQSTGQGKAQGKGTERSCERSEAEGRSEQGAGWRDCVSRTKRSDREQGKAKHGAKQRQGAMKTFFICQER